MKPLLAILFLSFLIATANAAGFFHLGGAGGGGGSGGCCSFILLVDNSSQLLQTDNVSNVCLTGGC